MEFTGCVYPRPGDTDIRVDADGREYPFSLTKAQVAEMDFVGLPIRLEHAERSTVGAVGRVVDVAQDPTTRRTAVKFRLDDTPAGNAAAPSSSATTRATSRCSTCTTTRTRASPPSRYHFALKARGQGRTYIREESLRT